MRIISQKTCGSLFLISKNSEKGADMEEIMKYPDYRSLSYNVMASTWGLQCLLILRLEASLRLLVLLASRWVFNFGSLEFSFALRERIWFFRLGWFHAIALSIGLLITWWLMGLQWCIKLHCDSSADVFMCLRVFVPVSSSKFSGSVLMNLKPVGPFKWDTQGTDVVVVDVYVDEDEL